MQLRAEGELDVVVTFITTQLRWSEETDVILESNEINRLKKTSLIRTSKLATLEIELIIGKIGELKKEKLDELDNKLKKVFELK